MPFSVRGAAGLLAACLVAVAVGYGGVADAFFVADDHVLLCALTDPHTRAGLLRAHETPFFRPLLALSFVAEWLLVHPGPRTMHVHNFVLHALAAWLLGLFAARWTESRPCGVLAALLFATYPLHPEAVTWITARGYPLGACGTLLALLVLRPGGSTPWLLVLGGLAAAAAMLSVEPALTLAAYPFLLGWARRWRSGLSLGLVAVVVTAGYFALRVAWLGGLGGYRASDGSSLHVAVSGERIAGYVLQALAHLVAPGPWDGAEGMLVTALVVGAAALGVLAFTAAAWRAGDQRMAAALGGCILAALSITAHWATLGSDLSGVRYLYFAALFWCVGLGWALARAFTAGGLRRRVAVATALALVVVQTLLLLVVNARWAQSGALARAAVDGVVERIETHGTHHFILLDPPAAYRGAHALPWAMQEAVRVFGAPDVRVEVLRDAAAYEVVQRTFAAAPPDARAGVAVGAWDEGARRWRWAD